MTWLIVTLIGLASAGFLATYVMSKRARKLKTQVNLLSDKLASTTLNLRMLKEAEVTDAQSLIALDIITEDIKNAKTDEDAAMVRREFVDSVLIGLQNMYSGKGNNPTDGPPAA